MRLEYPRGSGRYLDIEDITDNGVEVYDADDERFYIKADIKPSDLRVARLEQSSFAYWFSQHVGLGKKKPEQIEPGLFRLPMPDAYVFLGLEVEAKRCMEQLRHIRTKVKGEAVLITICPYTNLMCFQEGPMDIRLFPFLDVVHVNETGVAEKCDLKDSLHGAGRKEIRGSLRGFELPPDAVWEAICIEISTTSIHDAAYEDMFKDKVRFSFLRNGEQLRKTRPVLARELHKQFFTTSRPTELWLMLRTYALHEGRWPRKGVPTDNTNRGVVKKILRELVGLEDSPFKQTKGTPTRFTIRFADF